MVAFWFLLCICSVIVLRRNLFLYAWEDVFSQKVTRSELQAGAQFGDLVQLCAFRSLCPAASDKQKAAVKRKTLLSRDTPRVSELNKTYRC